MNKKKWIKKFGLRFPKSRPFVYNDHGNKIVTALTFDDSHELVWLGDSDGYIYSYEGVKLGLYSSSRAHNGPVLQILNHKKGIVSLAADGIRFGSRQGLSQYTVKSPPETQFFAMAYTSNTQTELLVGTNSNLVKIDLTKGVLSSTLEYNHPIQYMSSNLQYVVLGRVDGTVDIMDSKTSQVVKTFYAHSAALSSIALRDNVLLTSGYSLRQDQYVLDPFVNVFDLKKMTQGIPAAFPAGALQAHLHPKAPNVAVIVSSMGQINFIDICDPAKLHLYQADISSFLTISDISATGECFAFVDAMQTLHLWSDQMMRPPNFAVLSQEPLRPTLDVETIPPENHLSFDTDAPYNLIKLPRYESMLLSAWPSDLKFEVGKLPPQIDPEILRDSKTIDGFTMAPYNKDKFGPRNLHVKQRPLKTKKHADTKFPKFLSEREDDYEENEESVRLKQEMMSNAFEYVPKDGEVPNAFKKTDILYSKFGVDDFDFTFYNNTQYAGLETHVDNAYTNAMIQLYRFTPPIFNFVVRTLAEDVRYDDCVLAELGYLLDMLVKANGRNVVAANFQKLFSSLPQARELGLLNPDGKTRNDRGQRKLAHLFSKFLAECLAKDELALYHQETSVHVDGICGIPAHTLLRSPYCSFEHKSSTTVYSLDLNVVPSPAVSGVTILNYLEASMNKTLQHNIFCQQCDRVHAIEAVLSIEQLPNVLMLNVDLTNEQMNEVRGFDDWLVPEFYSAPSHTGRPVVRPNAIAGSGLAKYELVGFVAQITSRDSTNHLVTLVKLPSGEWLLLNDFLVTKISTEEALNLTYWWKRPVTVVYRQQDGTGFDYDGWKSVIDDSILYRDHFAQGTREGKKIEYELLTRAEAPKPGTLVAIDAEFVQMAPEEYNFRSNGSKVLVRPKRVSLARVSIIRGEGPKEGVCFIDDYILTDESKIDDYITSFSGIEPGDLTPDKSDKTLVTLQTAYRKIWLLLNLGCVFVGHSLGGDFRTINIQVPPQQVRDTAELFYLKREKRKLGLKFLIYQVFNDRVQTGNHDSIEDAYSALRLYRKWLELKAAGELDDALQRIYLEGQGVVSRTSSASNESTSSSSDELTDLADLGDLGESSLVPSNQRCFPGLDVTTLRLVIDLVRSPPSRYITDLLWFLFLSMSALDLDREKLGRSASAKELPPESLLLIRVSLFKCAPYDEFLASLPAVNFLTGFLRGSSFNDTEDLPRGRPTDMTKIKY
ncbi:hypothetical protein OGAPHI_000700 [Ogataea philodendri]|uniref:PAN2-PAN3 deadenylation complex catalytic subunit PAN2 n=1 Tax=Ogataea philodendri TaxID=1378263 RepID=A0A9P8PGF6_9ASCO|nr:uncharacterized protein OGAPHI_000700 [Ogataea philodendri]KAH3670989.1 hypothetical protein OGAPHI_000700 [Ogataea philodendri]